MWNKKEMSQLDAMLTRVPLTLTFDLEFSRSNCISGMGGLIVMERKGLESIGCSDVKHSRNESTGHCTDWGTFHLDRWPWIFKVKLNLGNGRPDCHGMKGTGVDRMPWCGRLRKWVNRTLRWLGYFWPLPLTLNFQGQIVSREWEAWLSWNGNESTGRCADWGTFDLCLWPWIFKVKLYLGNGRPDCHGTEGMGVNRMPWCKRQPLCAEETVRDRGDLRCQRFRRLILVDFSTCSHNCGWGLGSSSKVVVTFSHVGRSFNFFKYCHRGCLNNPIFSNLG